MTALIFVTFTYSSGMPALYWTDKILMTRYFRNENKFTADLSINVVNMLPWAMIVQIQFCYLMFAEPIIM